MHKQKIAIIGYGLLGRLVAILMIKSGYKIDIYDKSDGVYSSIGYIAGGMVSPHSEVLDLDKTLYEEGLNSSFIWKDILNAIKYHQDIAKGVFLLSHKKDISLLERFFIFIEKRLNLNLDNFLLSKREMKRLLLDISDSFLNGMLFPDDFSIDIDNFYKLSLEYIRSSTSRLFLHKNVEHIDNLGILHIDKNKVEYDFVIDCRGYGAKDNIKGLRAVRGEILRVSLLEDSFTPKTVRIVHPNYPFYIVPQQNNTYNVGATSIESEDDSDISVMGTLELLTGLYSFSSKFSEARIIRLATGLRPAFNDNRPKIVVNKKLITINGLYRHGYLLAPHYANKTLNLIKEQA